MGTKTAKGKFPVQRKLQTGNFLSDETANEKFSFSGKACFSHLKIFLWEIVRKILSVIITLTDRFTNRFFTLSFGGFVF